MGTQMNTILRTTALALTIFGLAACSSTSETEDMTPVAQESQGESAAARAARLEQERLERERQEQQRRERLP